MSILNEYIRNNRIKGDESLTERIECADGFTMSVQASKYHYCSPKIDGADHYTEVEVGFPSDEPKCFADYAENSENYTGTVYGYVPVHLVEQEIAAHGGLHSSR